VPTPKKGLIKGAQTPGWRKKGYQRRRAFKNPEEIRELRPTIGDLRETTTF